MWAALGRLLVSSSGDVECDREHEGEEQEHCGCFLPMNVRKAFTAGFENGRQAQMMIKSISIATRV